jgi:L-amino acid N-acyltransferase YncA
MNAVMSAKVRRSQTAATADMIIRDAIEADLPAIVDIYNATVPTRMVTAELEPTTVEARLPWFCEHSRDQHPFWVMESDGCVIGWLDFKKFLPRCAYRGTAEVSVYVDEKFRRQGVARRLLEEAIVRAPSLGITAIVGLVFAHNEPSLILFGRLGFERWGLLPRIARLDGIERDLIIMGRHIAAP